MDTPQWWVELTAISNVEDPKKLAQKIHVPLSQSQWLDVRPFPGQEYTAAPCSQVSHQG